MNIKIINKIKNLEKRYNEIQLLLTKKNVFKDQKSFISLSKELSQLSEIVHLFKEWKKIKEDINSLNEFIKDIEMKEFAKKEINVISEKKEKIENKLISLLLPKNKEDQCGCFLEIRAGTGGYEAALFASNLFRMYSRFSEYKNWKIDILNISYGDHGGYKEIITRIFNKNSYKYLRFESGGHRVQRIPETESQGRIHTSTCTVVVMPDIKEKELTKINIKDLRIDSFKSSGAGGQHVNKTDSAIRITHIPTGLVVECQNERSQHKNKAKALTIIKARLRALEINKRNKQQYCTRRNLLGSGDRSDRIRTYNFPQGRVTDHRINLTLYSLEEIIEGNLNILINPLIKEMQINQLNNFLKE